MSLLNTVPALEKNEIIPLVIPTEASFTPSIALTIEWPSSGKGPELGNTLMKEDTTDEPKIIFIGEKGKTYTLAMLDPDAPSRADPKFGQFRHWVITGLESTPEETEAVKAKPATTLYRAPGPGPSSGLHRYVFLLFEEPAGAEFIVPEDAPEHGSELEQRRKWNAYAFGEKYGLKLVGANYFLLHSIP